MKKYVVKENIEVMWASSFINRARGLLFRDQLSVKQAMAIVPCSSVHTFFMPYNIDLVFFDKRNEVLKIEHHLGSAQVIWCKGAYGVLEFLAGAVKQHDIAIGDTLNFLEKSK